MLGVGHEDVEIEAEAIEGAVGEVHPRINANMKKTSQEHLKLEKCEKEIKTRKQRKNNHKK